MNATRFILVGLMTLVVIAACDDTQVNYAMTEAEDASAGATAGGGGAADADTANPGDTIGGSPPDTVIADTEPPQEGSCYSGPCVPTESYLTWGPTCDSDADCPEGLACLPCQASSDCQSKDCRPACGVPYAPHALVPDPLRLSGDVQVPPGEEATVTVEGTSYYIGALGHRFRYRDEEVFGGGGSECSAQIRLPAASAGLHPVWVSQYSGGDPWVLAGFVRVGATVECVQPGFACDSGDAPCCATDDVPMACNEGRCRQR